jgi:flavin-dependent dehydrogenase
VTDYDVAIVGAGPAGSTAALSALHTDPDALGLGAGLLSPATLLRVASEIPHRA